MANRLFQQFRYSLEKNVVELFAQVTYGATGAPTLVTANSKGIKSVVRNSAGNYTITLQDTYFKFLGVDLTPVVPTGTPAAPVQFMVSQAVTSQTAPTIVLQYLNGTTATDPASGESVFLTIALGNSSAF